MSQGVQIRVFALSSEDIFRKGDLDFAINWLRHKGNALYYFRNKKPKNLPIGSIVLFSFEGKVFGQARTSEEVTRLSEQQQRQIKDETGFHYTGTVRFDADSIEVFDDYPLKKEITDLLGITFSRSFTILTRQEYQGILRMTGRRQT